MSTEKRKQKRSFAVIGRIFQLIFVLVFIFFLSFFVTLSIKTPHPIDFIQSRYFTEEQADQLIDEYANEEKKNQTVVAQNDKTEAEEKPKTYKSIDTSTLSGKFERASSIKQAVEEKISTYNYYVPLEDIPRSLRQAIIAVEDADFYKHSGFDLKGIARAAFVNFESGKIEEGGSTITQQLVKNMFLSQEQSFTRKAEELLLAYNMEKNFSKEKILEMYLNTIYFGSNFYGIYDAAEGYFGKYPTELTLAESAMLAGLPNAPSLYSPYVDYMLAKKRQLIVIDAMVKAKILTEREAENARLETITLAHDEG